MAKGSKRPVRNTKTVKSAGVRTAGSRPLRARKPLKTSPLAPSMDATSPAVRKAGGTRPGAGETGGSPSPEEVYRMIQETAYFKAKARDFAPGHEVQDWIEAEAEVRQRLENRAG
jgi:hypothetical protein